jgi:nickel-dependent lactate racemase
LKKAVWQVLDKIGPRTNVLIVPPDFTRFHSRAGEITCYIYEYYGNAVSDILPALGTHAPMSRDQINRMFPGVPEHLFRLHDWHNDVVTIGVIPREKVKEITENTVDYSWPAQLNKLIAHGGHDLILSVGQVVPHEVLGMANYNKNLLVGTGGSEGINKSHFTGAAYGMERIMGKAENPMRRILNYASENFMKHLPVVYMHTIIGHNEDGNEVLRGFYAGDDEEVFTAAAQIINTGEFYYGRQANKKGCSIPRSGSI